MLFSTATTTLVTPHNKLKILYFFSSKFEPLMHYFGIIYISFCISIIAIFFANDGISRAISHTHPKQCIYCTTNGIQSSYGIAKIDFPPPAVIGMYKKNTSSKHRYLLIDEGLPFISYLPLEAC